MQMSSYVIRLRVCVYVFDCVCSHSRVSLVVVLYYYWIRMQMRCARVLFYWGCACECFGGCGASGYSMCAVRACACALKRVRAAPRRLSQNCVRLI